MLNRLRQTSKRSVGQSLESGRISMLQLLGKPHLDRLLIIREDLTRNDPSARPGLRPWSAPSSPRIQSAFASPPPGGGGVAAPQRPPPRSRRTPSANGRTPQAGGPIPRTDLRPAPSPKDAASESPLS